MTDRETDIARRAFLMQGPEVCDSKEFQIDKEILLDLPSEF
jgi:hypothetical protein